MNILQKMLQDKISRISLIILCGLYFFIIFCDLISPYNPNSRDPKSSYLPPSMIYVFDSGRLSLPFIYKTSYIFDENTFTKQIIEDKSKKYFLNLFVQGDEYEFIG